MNRPLLVGIAALSAWALPACISKLNPPTPPKQAETEALAASYDKPTGMVDLSNIRETLGAVDLVIPSLALDWLPAYASGLLVDLNQRIEGSGLPSNPDASVEFHHFILSAVVELQRICAGWAEPAGPPNAAANGTIDATAIVENGRLDAEVWGTATACKVNLTSLNGALSGDGSLDGALTLLLLGPLPTDDSNARFLLTFTGQSERQHFDRPSRLGRQMGAHAAGQRRRRHRRGQGIPASQQGSLLVRSRLPRLPTGPPQPNTHRQARVGPRVRQRPLRPQEHREGRSPPFPALQGDPSPMRRGELTNEPEPEPKSATFLGRGVHVALEDPLLIGGGDADPVIADREVDAVLRRFDVDSNRPSQTEFQGIREQIADDLFDHRAIPPALQIAERDDPNSPHVANGNQSLNGRSNGLSDVN